MRFVIFNGPPNTGKSVSARDMAVRLRMKKAPIELTVSRMQIDQFPALVVTTDSFAAPMKNYIAFALGEKYQEMQKDLPRAELAGFSVREFLIAESEDHMKPKYGRDIFGRLLYHRAMRYTPKPDWVIVDDGGFVEEVECLGEFQPIIVRMSRPGCSFDLDSRRYLPQFDFEFQNDGDDAKRLRTIDALIDELV